MDTPRASPPRRRRRGVLAGAGAAVGVVASVGAVVAVRALLRMEWPEASALLSLHPLPVSDFAVAWSELAVWPGTIQEVAVARLVRIMAAMIGAVGAVAGANTLLMIVEAVTARAGEISLRGALGADTRRLARMLGGELRILLLGAGAVGVVVGTGTGIVLRATWPGAPLPIGGLPWDAAVAVAVVLGVYAVSYVRGGLRSAEPGRFAERSRTAGRVAADPGELFLRKAFTATHLAVVGSIAIASLTVAGAVAHGERPEGSGADSTVLLLPTAPADTRHAALAAIVQSGGAPAALASPGSLLGLGVMDIATAECGNCSRGGLPAPLWSVLTEHHFVTPGYFELAGFDIVEGQGLPAEPSADGERFALVNQTLARTAFENGAPVGKRIHIGEDFSEWYTIVGVVADAELAVPGEDEYRDSVVWLDARAHAGTEGSLLIRGDEEVVDAAVATATAQGLEPIGVARLDDYRRAAAAAFEWTRNVAVLLLLIVGLLAAQGVYAAATQTTRRRASEHALRAAVGGTPRSLVLLEVARRTRILASGTAGGLFLGLIAVAVLERSGGMAGPGVLPTLGTLALLAGLALLASLRAVRIVGAVEPATLLR